MIMKCKRMSDITKSHIGDRVPVRYNGEVIGTAIIGEYEIMVCVDKYERELKNAMEKPGMSWFSFEIVGSK